MGKAYALLVWLSTLLQSSLFHLIFPLPLLLLLCVALCKFGGVNPLSLSPQLAKLNEVCQAIQSFRQCEKRAMAGELEQRTLAFHPLLEALHRSGPHHHVPRISVAV